MKKFDKIDDEVIELFKKKNFAFVGTLTKDGSPQVIPTWVDYKDGFILINNVIGRQIQKNVDRDPRISVAVADRDNPYKMVSIRGTVIEQITKNANEHIEELSHKYFGTPYPFHSPTEQRVIIKVKPEKVFGLSIDAPTRR